jgi:uncharacterized protein (TIGR02453 family)
MVTKDVFSFLKKLKQNNNREWFHEHKTVFKELELRVKQFYAQVYEQLNTVDSIDTFKIFRIYRDVRFSKNKLPYKNHFSVGFSRTKPMLRGGYYLHIEPGASFVGGGFWEPNKEDLFRIRKEIELDASELRQIINQSTFKKYFGTLEGEELKTAPRDFDKMHPDIDLIRKKQFLVTRSFSDDEVLSPNFKDEVVETYKAMRPFFDYMSDVLSTNLNGESIY